jgi:hypothetical protein
MKQFENTSYSSVPDVRYNTALLPSSQESPACPSGKTDVNPYPANVENIVSS